MWQNFVYAPSGARDGLPLIVYLHGGSGRGDDLELVMEAESLPKLPGGETGWNAGTEGLAELIDAVVEDCGADAGRVSLTGHSMGGPAPSPWRPPCRGASPAPPR